MRGVSGAVGMRSDVLNGPLDDGGRSRGIFAFWLKADFSSAVVRTKKVYGVKRWHSAIHGGRV